jgi:hypothetical protein
MKRPICFSPLIATAFVAACFAFIQSPAWGAGSPSFPTKFRGDWYHTPGPCDRDGNRLALTVGSRSLDYFDEFSGRLTRIIRQSGRAVHYKAEYSAEGHRWNATETLRLSPKGNEMTLKPERTASRYFRCTIGAK